jgi:hypothetical protein
MARIDQDKRIEQQNERRAALAELREKCRDYLRHLAVTADLDQTYALEQVVVEDQDPKLPRWVVEGLRRAEANATADRLPALLTMQKADSGFHVLLVVDVGYKLKDLPEHADRA